MLVVREGGGRFALWGTIERAYLQVSDMEHSERVSLERREQLKAAVQDVHGSVVASDVHVQGAGCRAGRVAGPCVGCYLGVLKEVELLEGKAHGT